VGAVFVLNKDQKGPFLEAVRRLTPAEATRLMYEAVMAGPNKDGKL
jgi:hypothetical protein